MPGKSEVTAPNNQQCYQPQRGSHNGVGNGTASDDSGLPRYSEIPSSFASPPVPLRQQALAGTPGLPAINLSQYHIPDASISKDGTTVTVSSAQLCTNGDALANFLTAQAALPPRPQIRITGISEVYSERKVDFDIRVNLMRYLIPPPGEPPLNYVKLVEPNELAFRGDTTKNILPHVDGGLREWAWRFCRDSASNKAFALERVISKWNTSLLEGRIRNLLASLRYQGRITIDFPISHSTIVVTTPQQASSNFLPRLLSLVIGTKRYAVAQSIWPYANREYSERNGPDRVCAVQSEEEWWDVWSGTLAAAIMEKRKGPVTLDDVMDRAMMGNPPVRSVKPWGGSS